MDELFDTLFQIATNASSDWKNEVLIDNSTEDELVDAYNQGVRAMAVKVCRNVCAILDGKRFAKKVNQ